MKMGPVRINLSKGGVGFSAGIKGARVGINSRGRGYTHAGRYGLYHRQTFGKSRRQTRQATENRDRIELREDAGATFAATIFSIEPPTFRQKFSMKEFPVGIAVGLMTAISLMIWVTLPSADTPISNARGTLLGVEIATGAYLFLMMIIELRARKAELSLLRSFSTLIKDSNLGPSDLRQELENAFRTFPTSPAKAKAICATMYLETLESIISDGDIDDREMERLAAVEGAFQLEIDVIRDARSSIFGETYLEAVADHELTEEEEALLRKIQTRLSIRREDVAAEIEILERLSEARTIRCGEIPPEIDAEMKLQKGEVCYLKGAGRILSDKTLRTFQENGQKYAVRGLVVDKEGDLLITNKRLLLVHSGISSIPIDKIVDLEIDYDQSLLVITKEGAQKPVYISIPDPIRAGAILSRIADL